MRYTNNPVDFLSSPSQYQFNGDLLSHTLSSMSPSTAIIFLGSKTLEHPQEFTQSSHTPFPVSPGLSLSEMEPIYGTPYEVCIQHFYSHYMAIMLVVWVLTVCPESFIVIHQTDGVFVIILDRTIQFVSWTDHTRWSRPSCSLLVDLAIVWAYSTLLLFSFVTLW